MYLLEHDAKQLLATHGVPVPAGILVESSATPPTLPPGPWIVKAQLAAGGRGKAGGIRQAASENDARAACDAIVRARIRGLPVRGCRIEQQVSAAAETYLRLMVEPAEACVRVMLAAHGGVDIEAMSNQPGLIHSALCDPNAAAVNLAVRDLAADLSEPLRSSLAAAGGAL